MIAAIVAMSENRVIGVDNTLPWHLKADLQHFKKLTTGHAVIMGRKTFESIGRPLPNRENIIVTRNLDFSAEGCLVMHDLNEVIAYAKQQESVFIIGGAQLYQATLNHVDTLYITEVHTSLEGDAFFPELNSDEWLEVSRERFSNNEENDFDYSFVELGRVS